MTGIFWKNFDATFLLKSLVIKGFWIFSKFDYVDLWGFWASDLSVDFDKAILVYLSDRNLQALYEFW